MSRNKSWKQTGCDQVAESVELEEFIGTNGCCFCGVTSIGSYSYYEQDFCLLIGIGASNRAWRLEELEKKRKWVLILFSYNWLVVSLTKIK